MSEDKTTRLGEVPTFVWSISNASAVELASVVARMLTGYGATIIDTVGVWENEVELGARIEFQGPREVWNAIREAIAAAFPDERMAHEEVRMSAVTWRAMDDFRKDGA